MDIALASFFSSGLFVILALPVGWLAGATVRRYKIARSRRTWTKNSVIYAEYEVPHHLRPGEAAYLYDKAFGEPELLATVFDLEQRGKLKLTKLDKSPGGDDFGLRLIGEAMDEDLADYEQEILAAVKTYGKDAKWNMLKIDAAIWDSKAEKLLERDLTSRGYIREGAGKWMALSKYLAIGMVIAAIAVLLPVVLDDKGYGGGVINPTADAIDQLGQELGAAILGVMWLTASAIFGLAVYYGVSAYYRGLDISRGTPLLRNVWPKLAGFREYLKVVEEDRIKFENETMQEQARAKALPYAVALELRTDWQTRFEQP